jgi:putative solute:sodium symporter small subunit
MIDDDSYWRRTTRFTITLLVLWAAAAFAAPLLAVLTGAGLTKVPIAFHRVVQISLLAFLAMLVFAAWRQDIIDREEGAAEYI